MSSESTFSKSSDENGPSGSRTYAHQSLKKPVSKIRKKHKSHIKNCAKPFIKALKLFESNIGSSCLIYGYLENIMFELVSQKSFIDDSVDEILFLMTQTFTNGESNNFKGKIIESAERDSRKFDKYFNEFNGTHPPSKQFFPINSIFQSTKVAGFA